MVVGVSVCRCVPVSLCWLVCPCVGAYLFCCVTTGGIAVLCHGSDTHGGSAAGCTAQPAGTSTPGSDHSSGCGGDACFREVERGTFACPPTVSDTPPHPLLDRGGGSTAAALLGGGASMVGDVAVVRPGMLSSGSPRPSTVCVCVRACVRERERERERGGGERVFRLS